MSTELGTEFGVAL